MFRLCSLRLISKLQKKSCSTGYSHCVCVCVPTVHLETETKTLDTKVIKKDIHYLHGQNKAPGCVTLLLLLVCVQRP